MNVECWLPPKAVPAKAQPSGHDVMAIFKPKE
jgi:hypothetical protein